MLVPGLIVKKVGMTRVYDTDGKMIPVTLLQADTQKVTKTLTKEKNGYSAIQVGFHEKREKLLNKPDKARLSKVGVENFFSEFKEMRLDEDAPTELQVGVALTMELFKDITAVDVTGLSKGRGTQGTVRRFGTATGRRTHGSRFHRRPGSLGMRSTPGKVVKNKKMPGRMGHTTTTIQNLSVVNVDSAANVIALKGSVPGHRDGYLVLKPSVKLKG